MFINRCVRIKCAKQKRSKWIKLDFQRISNSLFKLDDFRFSLMHLASSISAASMIRQHVPFIYLSIYLNQLSLPFLARIRILSPSPFLCSVVVVFSQIEQTSWLKIILCWKQFYSIFDVSNRKMRNIITWLSCRAHSTNSLSFSVCTHTVQKAIAPINVRCASLYVN